MARIKLLHTLFIYMIISFTRAAAESSAVTCQSAVKLTNVQSDMRLHSHEINWGSGSTQQSITTHNRYNAPIYKLCFQLKDLM